MAKTTKSDVIIADLWDEAVRGAFAQKGAFLRSGLIASGAAAVVGDMPKGEPDVGETIKVPYFGVIGDFEDVAADGDPLVPKKIQQASEQATVAHSGLAMEMTRWARSSVGGDIYQEGASQMVTAMRRFMDRKLVTAAYGTPLAKDVYSATVPQTMNYDLVVDSKLLWGDEQEDIAAMIVNSKVYSDMLKLKDGVGHPLITKNAAMGGFPEFCGMPIVVSDHLRPAAAEVMGAVTEAGTTPPDLTLAGTPLGAFNLKVLVTLGGARGTAKFKFSTDGGLTYSAEITTVDDATARDLVDTTADSQIGVNGQTGLTYVWEDATFNTDNVYTASYAKHTSLIVKANALVFWYNRDAIQLMTDKDILADSDIGAHHLYYACHRYKRVRGGTKTGVVKIVHN